MRYGIFSDVHSNLEALDEVISAYKKDGIDKYLCIGDIIGYATNPKECIEKVKVLVKVSVAGNHDKASVNLFSTDYFNSLAKEAIIWTGRHLDGQNRGYLKGLELIYKNEDLTMVHGTLEEPQDFNYMTDGYTATKTFELLKTDICFVGHTHVSGAFIKSKEGSLRYQAESNIDIKEGNKYIINVGSVGQPRDGNPQAAYCIYDTGKKKVEIKRVSYDAEITRSKIIHAGLPGFLGERLLAGR